MKAFGDFLAIILFFVIYTMTKNIVWATIAATVVGIVQAAYTWFKVKKLSAMQWMSLIVVVVFGGLTIILDDPVYVMLKTTVVCWLTALAVWIAKLMGHNGVKILMSAELTLPEKVWDNLAYAWVGFFIVMGLVNLAIAYPFTSEQVQVWANYKLYGYIPLVLIFSLGQGWYIFKFLPKETGE